MNSRYIDFIGMYENVYPDGFCHHMIEEFERFLDKGICGNRKNNENTLKTYKDDSYCFLNLKNHYVSPFNGQSANDIFMAGIQRCFDEYESQFDVLAELNIKCTSIKMQKTVPGAGYHIWHCEQTNNETANRCMVYSLYLNDIDNAGETEFLYQKLRIPPKENCVIIWPASYTHAHRGNVVHGDKSKYIITGWFYLE